ncbi:MAG: TolC family protein, partial [Bacteroidota bacterium]|nr:TolC family protein [Bacteroidota bacterium]
VLILFLFSSFSLMAQENLSVSRAIEIGLENNYQIKISGLNIDIAKENTGWASVGAYPTVNVGAININRFDDNSTGKFTTNSFSPNITANMVLFNGFAIRINKERMDLLQDASEGNETIVIENTLQAIILGYNKVLLEKQKLEVVKEVMELSRDRFNYEKTKKEIGASVTFNVLQAKNAYLSDSSNYLIQQNNFKNTKRNLNLLLAVDIKKEYVFTDEYKINIQNFELENLENKLLQNNSTIKNQYINQKILQQVVALKKSALYPTIAMQSGYDHSSMRTKPDGMDASTSNSFDYYANFTLSFNLYNAGNTRGDIKSAKIDEKIGALRIEEMKKQMINTLYATYDFYNVRQQLYSVAVENMAASKLNMQIAEDKFKAGTITSFNYRDIQMVYLNSALNKFQSIYNLIDSRTELIRITGGIIEEK